MIHYALRCGDGHEFDGWFRSSVSFDQQATAGLLDCPVCANTTIRRALMAPRIAAGAAASKPPPADTAKDTPPQTGAAPPAPAETPPAPLPDGVRAALQRIRAEVEKNCEYVGPQFAKEVRRMAEKTVPPRPVYGEATPAEAEALAEDGIDVTRIPWVPRADS
jgi:hypothetical protein